jgi:hypothetical protein
VPINPSEGWRFVLLHDLPQQRKSSQDLLQVHDLAGNELGDGESDYLNRPADIAKDALHLSACQAAGFGAEPQDDFIAVDGVNIEVHGDTRTAGASQPVQQPLARLSKVVGTERGKPPRIDIREVVVSPRLHTDKGYAVREIVAGSGA